MSDFVPGFMSLPEFKLVGQNVNHWVNGVKARVKPVLPGRTRSSPIPLEDVIRPTGSMKTDGPVFAAKTK